nr:unnamed protein product [Spirometra erinaceieuropaei]
MLMTNFLLRGMLVFAKSLKAGLQKLQRRLFEEYAPIFWVHYVNVPFVIINHAKINYYEELRDLVVPDLQFTMKEEMEDKLPFLDALVCRQSDGKLATSALSKPTNMLQMLCYNSNHEMQHRRICVCTLYGRVKTHCITPDTKLDKIKLSKNSSEPTAIREQSLSEVGSNQRSEMKNLVSQNQGLGTLIKTTMQRQMTLRMALLSTLMLLQVVTLCLSSNLEASASDAITAENSHWVDRTSETFTDRHDIMSDSTIAGPVNEAPISQKSTISVSGIPGEFSTIMDRDDSNPPSKISHTAPAAKLFTGTQQSSSDGLFAASDQFVIESANETTKPSNTTALPESDAITSHLSVGTPGNYLFQQSGTILMHMVDYDDNQDGETTSMEEKPTFIKREDDHRAYVDAETTEIADMDIEESAVTDVCTQSRDCPNPLDRLSTSASGENDVDIIASSASTTKDILESFAEAETHVSGSSDEREVKTTENTSLGSENVSDQHHSSVISMEPQIQTEKIMTAVSEQEKELSFTSQDVVSSGSAQSDSYARIPTTENIQNMQATSTTNNDLSPLVNLSTGQFEPYSTLKASVPQADSSRFATEVSVVSQDVGPTTGISVDPVNTAAAEKEWAQLQTGEFEPSELLHSVDSGDSDTMAYTSTDTSEESREASTMQGNTSEMTVASEGTILSSPSWVKEPLATVISLSSDGETSSATDAILTEQPVGHYFAPSTYTMASSDTLAEENFSDTETGQDEMTSTANATPESITFNDMEVITQKEPEGTTRPTELSIEKDNKAYDVSKDSESDEYLQSNASGKVMIKTASPTTAVESAAHGSEYTATSEDLALSVLIDASTDVSTPSEEDNFKTVVSSTADEGAGYVSEQVTNATGSPQDYKSDRLTAIHSDAPLGTTETDQEGMPQHEETDESDELEFTQSSLQTNIQPSEDSKGQVDHNERITPKDVSDVTPSEAWEATDSVNSGDGEELVANEDDIATADQTTFLYLRGSQFRIPRYTKTNSARTTNKDLTIKHAHAAQTAKSFRPLSSSIDYYCTASQIHQPAGTYFFPWTVK